MTVNSIAPSAPSPSVIDGFWARTAFLAIVIWPACMGYVVLRNGMSAYAAEALATVSVSVFLLLAGLTANRGQGFRVLSVWQTGLAALVVLAFVASAAFTAIEPAEAITKGLIDAVLASGAVGAFMLLRAGGEPAIRRLLLCLVLSGLVYIAFYVILFQNLVAHAGGQVVYSFLPFVNVRRFTNILAPMTGLAIALWAISGPKSRRANWGYGIAATLFVTFLIWSGGRAPVAAVFVGLTGVALLVDQTMRRHLIGRLIFAYAVGSIANLWLPSADGNFDFWSRLVADEKISTVAGFTSNRMWLWQETARMIPDHLWFGYGYKLWVLQRPEFIHHGSVHNFPLQIVFDLGLIGGGAALILAFGTWIGQLRRLRQTTPIHLVALAGLSVMMVQCLLDGIFTGRPSLQLALLCFATAAAARNVPVSAEGVPTGRGEA